MKVTVDRTLCTGLGQCEVAVPSVFEIDDEGDLVILVEHVAPEELDAVRGAVQRCPTQALTLTDPPSSSS